MNKGSIEEKHFSLLCSFANICKEKNISFVLAEHSAWDAIKFHKYHGKMWESSVMLTEDNWGELVNLGISHPYQLYSNQSNPYIAWFFDQTTTLIDYRDLTRYPLPAVGLKIIIARQESDKKLSVARPDGSIFRLSKNDFDKTTLAILENTEFPILANYDNYFSLLVSPKWRNKNWPYAIPKQDIEVIFFSDYPFNQFLKRPIAKKSLSLRKKYSRKLYWKWRDQTYKPNIKKIANFQSYLTLTEDRFRLWEYYYPKKQNLIKLAESSPLEPMLIQELDPYIKTIDKHLKHKLGIYFDEDIFKITLPILENKFGDKYVLNYCKLIPKEHKKNSIDLVLNRYQIQHPLLQPK